MLQLLFPMACWVALGELLLPTGPHRLHQETIAAVLRNPKGLLPLLMCHSLHCMESAAVLTTTNVLPGRSVSAWQGPERCSGPLCAPTSVGCTLEPSVTGFSVDPCPCQALQAPPQEMQAHELHGSAWNLKPGPHPGCRQEGGVTQKSVSLRRWKPPLHPRDDATGIQEKALALETGLTGDSFHSLREAGLRNSLL